jgi:hypothetical protein
MRRIPWVAEDLLASQEGLYYKLKVFFIHPEDDNELDHKRAVHMFVAHILDDSKCKAMNSHAKVKLIESCYVSNCLHLVWH